MVTHSAFSSDIYHQSRALGYSRNTRVYEFASYVFDAAIETMFMTLATGGCLCVPSEAERKDNLTASLVASKATLVELTASVARSLRRDQLVRLKYLILGGEAIQRDDLRGWPDNVTVINTYGPSECTPTSTIQLDVDHEGELNNIGVGAGLVPWLVDPNDSSRLAPFGATAELLLEGPLVGAGYLADPEKKAAAFITDPGVAATRRAWSPWTQRKSLQDWRSGALPSRRQSAVCQPQGHAGQDSRAESGNGRGGALHAFEHAERPRGRGRGVCAWWRGRQRPSWPSSSS